MSISHWSTISCVLLGWRKKITMTGDWLLRQNSVFFLYLTFKVSLKTRIWDETLQLLASVCRVQSPQEESDICASLVELLERESHSEVFLEGISYALFKVAERGLLYVAEILLRYGADLNFEGERCVCCELNMSVIRWNWSEKQSNKIDQRSSFDFRFIHLFTPAVSLVQRFCYSAHLHIQYITDRLWSGNIPWWMRELLWEFQSDYGDWKCFKYTVTSSDCIFDYVTYNKE